MDEFECMKAIHESLQSVVDDDARTRIATWITAKYLRTNVQQPVAMAQRVSDTPIAAEYSGQIPGIAKLSQSGELQLTVRDFKAKSANEAAIRLMHVVVWATGKLTSETSVSSKHIIVPLLKKYRCYDGNTRGAIAKDKGLVRDGDSISLDFHAEQFAEKIVSEILDPSVEGRWKPGSTKRRKTRSVQDLRGEGE